eukprot:scaffold8367_cov91-Cyclotella_meneghiniana.AAC.4
MKLNNPEITLKEQNGSGDVKRRKFWRPLVNDPKNYDPSSLHTSSCLFSLRVEQRRMPEMVGRQ